MGNPFHTGNAWLAVMIQQFYFNEFIDFFAFLGNRFHKTVFLQNFRDGEMQTRVRKKNGSLAGIARVFEFGYEVCDSIFYHEDFLMPGIMPSFANSRKQIRHRPKSRIKPFLRAQRKQRRTTRLLNFGFLRARARTDALAMNDFLNKRSELQKIFTRKTFVAKSLAG